MDTRRARMLVGSAIAAGLWATGLVAPATAADCLLSAPATVSVGEQLTISGAGFPASSSVDVDIAVEGGASDSFTVQSNAAGEIQINLTPEVADAGETTVSATAGTACSSQVVVTVLLPGQTAPPTTAPDGGAAGAGAEPSAPRTDAKDSLPPRATSLSGAAWLVAFIILGLGLGGLLATRSQRSSGSQS